MTRTSAWDRWRVLSRATRYERARRAQAELRRLGLCPGRRLEAVERLRRARVQGSADRAEVSL